MSYAAPQLDLRNNRERTRASQSRHATVTQRNAAGPARERATTPETYESRERRVAAAKILESWETLSWFAMQRHENILAGFNSGDEEEDWEMDFTPDVPAAGDAASKSTTGAAASGGMVSKSD
ncbi:hypothetical protein LTR28_007058, partial [Elasticomyces elasticus]